MQHMCDKGWFQAVCNESLARADLPDANLVSVVLHAYRLTARSVQLHGFATEVCSGCFKGH